MINYTFDLVVNSHTVSNVNLKTGEVVIGMSDISGLNTAINNAKFDGNLTGNLTVSGTSSFAGNVNMTGNNTIIRNGQVDNDLTVYGLLKANEIQSVGSAIVGTAGKGNGLTVNGIIQINNDGNDASLVVNGGLQGLKLYTLGGIDVGGGSIVRGDLTVQGNLNANINASNLNISYNYYANSPPDANPSWCRIMTINKAVNRFTPIKFNILGSRGNASGWPIVFDEDYFIRFRRDTTTDDLSNTYYYDCNRKINYPNPPTQLSFVRISFTVMDVYLYRETTYLVLGSILINKISTDIITTYTSESVLSTAPENSKYCPVKYTTIPVPPATGNYTLQSRDGVLSWA
jgi:hypothetical protein